MNASSQGHLRTIEQVRVTNQGQVSKRAYSCVDFHSLGIRFAIAVALCFAVGVGAQAVEIVVNSAQDNLDPGDGMCTLREAILNANSNVDTTDGDCAPGEEGPGVVDEIVFAPMDPPGPYTLEIAGPEEDDGRMGDLDILDDVIIIGNGKDETTIVGDGEDRVFHIQAPDVMDVMTVQLQNLTITGGKLPLGGGDFGGGIFVQTSGVRLSVVDSAIVNNIAGLGGGVFGLNFEVNDELNVIDSSIDGNTGIQGGGIFSLATLLVEGSTVKGNAGGGIATLGLTEVRNSTVSHNTVTEGLGPGGGIVAAMQPITITNSTISSNSSVGSGGAIFGLSDVVIVHSTISGNVSDDGDSGAIDFFEDTTSLVVRGSIIEGNLPRDCSVSLVISEGYNIDSDDTCGLSGVNDLRGIDPMLQPLANNGGNTETQAPELTSAAVDQVPLEACLDADGLPLTEDQRGVIRPIGGMCDIGAVEVDSEQICPPSDIPPQIHSSAYIDSSAVVENGVVVGREAMVRADAKLRRRVVLSKDVVIGRRAIVRSCAEIGRGAEIRPDARIGSFATVGREAVVRKNAMMDDSSTVGRQVLLGRNARLGREALVNAWSEIGRSAKIGEGVTIDQDATIGSFVKIRRDSVIGRNVILSRGVVVGEGATVGNKTTVGRNTELRSGSSIGRNVDIGNNVVVEENCVVPNRLTIPDGAVFECADSE